MKFIKILFPLILVVTFLQCNKQKLKSEEATKLLEFLNENSKTNILFGQQDAIAYGIGWKNKSNFSDVKTIVGKHPAIVGFDLSNIGNKEKNVENISFNKMKSLIKWFNKKNGIVTLSWHMLNPKTKQYAWETEDLNENLVKQLLTNKKLKTKYLKQLDEIAKLLNDLKDEQGKQIPILFRPFHEANGKHFWWSSKFTTTTDFINLWQFTHQYLTKTKKQNQLLFVFSSDVFESKKEYLNFYAGDDFVDILAFDDFHSLESEKKFPIFKNEIKILEQISIEKNKPYAIAEVGNTNLIIPKYFTDILFNQIFRSTETKFPAYIFTWRNGTSKYFHTPFLNSKPSIKNDFKRFERNKHMQFLERK